MDVEIPAAPLIFWMMPACLGVRGGTDSGYARIKGAANEAFCSEEFGIEECLRLYIPGFLTRLAQNIGRQRHWEILCVLHKLEMVG